MNVQVNKRVERDLDDIWDFIAPDTIEAANKVIDAIYNAMKRLGDGPDIGHSRNDVRRPGLRFLRVYSYLIIYRRSARRVTITRVVRGARNLRKLFPKR
jgi:plasmid stabilization system protein ParE